MKQPTDDVSARRPGDEPAPARAEDPGATADSADDALAALADQFAACVRRGERVKVDDYAATHPDLASRIRRVFPAIAAIEGHDASDATAAAAAPGERLGGTIGRYKLLERIGEGGFGVIYMAEQHHPVRRRVALKVIKPGDGQDSSIRSAGPLRRRGRHEGHDRQGRGPRNLGPRSA